MYNPLAPDTILNANFQMILPDLIMSVLEPNLIKQKVTMLLISIQIDAKKEFSKENEEIKL